VTEMKSKKRELYDAYWFLEDFSVYVLFDKALKRKECLSLAWAFFLYSLFIDIFNRKTVWCAKGLEGVGLDEVNLKFLREDIFD
jgi:hypothetical protein